jgi:hypothetical protein
MLAGNTDPAFSPPFTRHDLLIGVGRLETAIGKAIKVPADAASPSAPLEKGTQESAQG